MYKCVLCVRIPFILNKHCDTPDTSCVSGTVHLVGGDDISRGRVEYCFEGTWYSVCASGWDETGEEARVVCRTLGYPYGIIYYQK